MLSGQYAHQIDDKGRIRIPAKMKKDLGDSPMIVKGSSGCLFILPTEEADKLFGEIFDSFDIDDSPRTRALRIMAASAITAEPDKQGRVLLPQSLINEAGIVKDIVINGAGKRAELWSKERWEAYLAGGEGGSFDDCLKTLRR